MLAVQYIDIFRIQIFAQSQKTYHSYSFRSQYILRTQRGEKSNIRQHVDYSDQYTWETNGSWQIPGKQNFPVISKKRVSQI